MNTLQLNSRYDKDYQKMLETEELEPGLLGRISTTIHEPEERLDNIQTSNLIFVFSEFSLWSSSANCAENDDSRDAKPAKSPAPDPVCLVQLRI